MGYRPGPLFREILEAVEEAQLDGRIHTPEEALELVRGGVSVPGLESAAVGLSSSPVTGGDSGGLRTRRGGRACRGGLA